MLDSLAMDTPEATTPPPDWLAMDDTALLADCDVHIYKASGPGGQHRNKVSSAVRLRHRPSGVTAHGDDTRSQHDNKRLALKRVRMQIALQVRRPFPGRDELPAVLAACVFTPRRGPPRRGPGRLAVGRKDHRFWPVAQVLLDALDDCGGGLADAAAGVGVNTSNLVAQLKRDRHLFAAAQQIRKRHGLGPVK